MQSENHTANASVADATGNTNTTLNTNQHFSNLMNSFGIDLHTGLIEMFENGNGNENENENENGNGNENMPMNRNPNIPTRLRGPYMKLVVPDHPIEEDPFVLQLKKDEFPQSLEKGKDPDNHTNTLITAPLPFSVTCVSTTLDVNTPILTDIKYLEEALKHIVVTCISCRRVLATAIAYQCVVVNEIEENTLTQKILVYFINNTNTDEMFKLTFYPREYVENFDLSITSEDILITVFKLMMKQAREDATFNPTGLTVSPFMETFDKFTIRELECALLFQLPRNEKACEIKHRHTCQSPHLKMMTDNNEKKTEFVSTRVIRRI